MNDSKPKKPIIKKTQLLESADLDNVWGGSLASSSGPIYASNDGGDYGGGDGGGGDGGSDGGSDFA
jgi:hypothetical protein